jgi:glycosyltransferase involved in cell wall biosynthesis
MKIQFVAHNFIRGNGQGRINYEIVRHALRSGHNVELIADQVAPELISDGAKWTYVAQHPHRPNVLGVRVFARSANHVIAQRGQEADVIVGAGFTLDVPHDVNLCQFVHGAWIKSPVHTSRFERGPYGWYQYLYSRLNTGWEKRAYRNAGMVVAPSEKIREELISIGVPAERIRVIYNGVDLNEFTPQIESNSPLRNELGLKADVPLALFVGDIRTPRKNLDTVLKALVLVPGLHLAILGAERNSPFPAMAASLQVAERAHFMGFRTNVSQFMRACDMFVFPSRYEAGTLVLLEAAASGVPIITARSAGGCEVLDSAAAQILEDPNDFRVLAAAMRKLIQSPQQRRAAGIAARGIAERYSWELMSRAYLELFAAAAKNRRREVSPLGQTEPAESNSEALAC